MVIPGVSYCESFNYQSSGTFSIWQDRSELRSPVSRFHAPRVLLMRRHSRNTAAVSGQLLLPSALYHHRTPGLGGPSSFPKFRKRSLGTGRPCSLLPFVLALTLKRKVRHRLDWKSTSFARGLWVHWRRNYLKTSPVQDPLYSMALSKTSILLGENDQPYFENTIVCVFCKCKCSGN